MESPPNREAGEECHSTESGWTMYIGSPMEEDSGSTNGDNDEEEERGGDYNNASEEDRDVGDGEEGDDDGGNGCDEAESDDSMASDASSRPTSRGVSTGPRSGREERPRQRKGGAAAAAAPQTRGKVRKDLRMGKK